MKNAFIWYYLLGLPMLLIITDITLVFGVTSMIELMKVILGIYYFGFILVGLFFFGYLQEWIMKIINDIKILILGWTMTNGVSIRVSKETTNFLKRFLINRIKSDTETETTKSYLYLLDIIVKYFKMNNQEYLALVKMEAPKHV
jgi:hypothetical protein